MKVIELRYLASRDWMSSAILAGSPVDSRHQILPVEQGNVDEALFARVEEIDDSVVFLDVERNFRTCVLDSGIDPESRVGPEDTDLTPLDHRIVGEIGILPELDAPTDDVLVVVEKWEEWLAAYKSAALSLVAELNEDPPQVVVLGKGGKKARWGTRVISLSGEKRSITLDDGPEAIRDAWAGNLWRDAANEKFSRESLLAAREATRPTAREARELFERGPDEAAAAMLEYFRKRFKAAKAHDAALRAKTLDFDSEMKRWSAEHGSERLQLGLSDGYRMNSTYLKERIASEVPGTFAMPATSAQKNWASKATSPSEAALRLRRRIEAAINLNAPANVDGQPRVTIMVVKKPPHEIYLADGGVSTQDGIVGADLPSRAGWPWKANPFGGVIGSDPIPFEAVVVENWLGRFHLIGAVEDPNGTNAEGIWAKPDLDLFAEDGHVQGLDPDAPAPEAARRKPPEPGASENDIPF